MPTRATRQQRLRMTPPDSERDTPKGCVFQFVMGLVICKMHLRKGLVFAEPTGCVCFRGAPGWISIESNKLRDIRGILSFFLTVALRCGGDAAAPPSCRTHPGRCLYFAALASVLFFQRPLGKVFFMSCLDDHKTSRDHDGCWEPAWCFLEAALCVAC